MSRGKFDNVPTESLFSDGEIASYRQSKSSKPAVRPVRSVAQGNCPECTKNPVGLIRQGEHLYWRQHYVTTWRGTPMLCRAANVSLCVAPDKPQSGITTHMCPHDGKGGK